MFGLFKKSSNRSSNEKLIIINKPLRISSVDLRDGNQSLLATRIKTEDMLPILDKMDSVGFDCAEVWGGATFDVCLRYLNEDPWNRLREIKKRMRRTPLRAFIRGQSLVGYRHYPDDVVEKFVEKAADAGIDIFLVFDILHDNRNLETLLRAVKKIGKRIEGQINYFNNPCYDVEKYVEYGESLESMGFEAIHVEDGAGVLTPKISYELIKALKETVKMPIHLQCHSTGGLACLAYWEAIRAGVDVVDTDISALSQGTAHPPLESIVAALKDTPRDTGFDLGLLEEINRYFLGIREKYREHESKFTGVDVSVFMHQIPGGMLSNLESQLKQMGMLDKLEEVFEEVRQVWKDFGYPQLGTPLSQIVGTQAVFNVITGERYKMVPKEAKDYIAGLYGKPIGEINPEVEKKVLGSAQKITCRPADLLEPALEKLKGEIGELARNEEDLLSYALFPNTAKELLMKKDK
jgi:pyruvate/oxaloacetate carboxyltransferase